MSDDLIVQKQVKRGKIEPLLLTSTDNFLNLEILPGQDFHSLEACQDSLLHHLARLIAGAFREALEQGILKVTDDQVVIWNEVEQ